MAETMAEKKASQDTPVTIKKYANRRLYNTATSSYVTLDHLSQMVKDGVVFVVFDAKSGEDITRSVLTQIIMDEESKGHNLLPTSFLRQIIGFYGDSLSSFVPRYLELSMETFARNQEKMRANLEDAFGGFFPFKQIEDMGKTNMAMFQRAMDMFPPFAKNTTAATGEGPGDAGQADKDRAEGGKNDDQTGADLDDLRRRLNAMQAQLDRLSRRDPE